VHVLLSDIAQTVGLLLFVAAFGLVLWYALTPKNRKTFDKASRMALDDEEKKKDD
jgi:cytochrome c oxidase cbb3-type subunit 4